MNQSLNIRLDQVSFKVIYFLWLAYLVSIGHDIITLGEWILALHEVTVTEVRDLTLALLLKTTNISQLSLIRDLWNVYIGNVATMRLFCFQLQRVVSRGIWKPATCCFRFKSFSRKHIFYPNFTLLLLRLLCILILYWPCRMAIIPSSILPYIFATYWCHSLEYPTGVGQSCST